MLQDPEVIDFLQSLAGTPYIEQEFYFLLLGTDRRTLPRYNDNTSA